MSRPLCLVPCVCAAEGGWFFKKRKKEKENRKRSRIKAWPVRRGRTAEPTGSSGRGLVRTLKALIAAFAFPFAWNVVNRDYHELSVSSQPALGAPLKWHCEAITHAGMNSEDKISLSEQNEVFMWQTNKINEALAYLFHGYKTILAFISSSYKLNRLPLRRIWGCSFFFVKG